MRWIALALVLAVGCAQQERDDMEAEVAALRLEASGLRREAATWQKRKDKIVGDVNDLREVRSIVGLDDPLCILRVKVKQSRVSLNLWKHAKDAMNAFEFEVPVDCEFFREHAVGDKLASNFRGGSLFVSGTWSNLNVTITSKRVVEREKGGRR